MSETMIDVINDFLDEGVDPLAREQELWDHFGKERAVVVIDSTGFSKTTFKRGIIYTLSRLARKRKIIAPVLERFGCDE